MSWLIPKKLRPSVRAQEKAKYKVKGITNDMLLAELDAIFLDSVESLSNYEHKSVVNVLKYLILHDLELRRIIGNQIQNVLTVSESTLNGVIELQSYYNLFRTNLMVEVVKTLMEGYNKTINYLAVDYDYAMQMYQYTKKINDYYLREIRHYLGQRDVDQYQSRIYEESMQTFEEVHQTANRSIRKLINIQLRALQI